MKKSNLLMLTVCALGLSSSLLTACDEYKLYTIDAPDDLQDRIDSLAIVNNPERGDTLTINILTAIVGAEDNSAGWWAEFSDYFTVPTNRLLHLEFVNYGTGENNWNNWNLCISNGERDGDQYSEYFVLRSDAYGWGNGDFDLQMISHDYAETLEGDDMWATFRQKMQGAYVYMDIDHSRTGNVFVTATHVATDGTTFVQSYQQPVSSTNDINAFLICDGSHFVMKEAYTITSKVQAVDDQNAVSITATGYPESIEAGDEDFWGNAVATVTFEDGSSTVVDKNDLSFTVPDLTIPGTATIIYSYSKTKQGNYGKSVAGYYTLEVNNRVTAIEVTKMPNKTTYYTYGGAVSPLLTDGLEISAVFVNGTTGTIPVSSVVLSDLKPEVGTQAIEVSYSGKDGVVTTSFDVEVLAGTGLVGATDFTNAFWTTFTEERVVAPGTSTTFTMTLLSNNVSNWNSPCTILRKADLSEYAVLRMDNYGWGDNYATATLESDWNFDTLAANLNGSEVTITITNNGDNTADVVYNVILANGEVHVQKYLGLAVDSNDLQTALVCESSALILHD